MIIDLPSGLNFMGSTTVGEAEIGEELAWLGQHFHVFNISYTFGLGTKGDQNNFNDAVDQLVQILKC